MRHILRCEKCFKYTMNEACTCGGKASNAKPPKWSPEDKYAKYRRKVKSVNLKKEGLL